MNDAIDLKQQLTLLMQLQAIDIELRELELDRGELPSRVDKMQKDISAATRQVAESTHALERAKERKLAIVRELEEAKTRKKKFEDALYKVSNNREYDSLTRELDEVQKTLGKRAQEQLDIVGEISKLEEEKTQREAVVAKLAVEFEAIKLELSAIVDDSADHEAEMLAERNRIEPQIVRPIYNHYERIRNARDGRGTAPLMSGSCGGCYNSVPPQKQVEVRTFKDFILCEACGRVLVPEEAKN